MERWTCRSSGRGAVLFEVLLALALFVGAAAFTLGALRSSLTALDRSRRESLAADLARSKMSELEAGLITVADLQGRERGLRRVGSVELAEDQSFATGAPGSFWTIDVRTGMSEFSDLTLVELTVRETTTGEADRSGVSCTLRQLVALRGIDSEEYEADDLLRGLPEGSGGRTESGGGR